MYIINMMCVSRRTVQPTPPVGVYERADIKCSNIHKTRMTDMYKERLLGAHSMAYTRCGGHTGNTYSQVGIISTSLYERLRQRLHAWPSRRHMMEGGSTGCSFVESTAIIQPTIRVGKSTLGGPYT